MANTRIAAPFPACEPETLGHLPTRLAPGLSYLGLVLQFDQLIDFLLRAAFRHLSGFKLSHLAWSILDLFDNILTNVVASLALSACLVRLTTVACVVPWGVLDWVFDIVVCQ